jgi:hypothetical protein
MRPQLFCICFLLLGFNAAAQELIGTDRVLPGTLVSFEIIPPQEASWYIVPPSPDKENGQENTYQVDTGQSKIYFASPERGRYTVIAGIVNGGKPEMLIKTFFNGEEERPIPNPPISSLESWIKTQLPILVTSKNLVLEVGLVTGCYDEIVRRIEEANIRTVQNAQAQLQIALTEALARASPTAVNDWLPFLTELSHQLDKELGTKPADLAEVKKVLQCVSDALKSLEFSKSISTPLRHIDPPSHRTQNRIFRTFLSP